MSEKKWREADKIKLPCQSEIFVVSTYEPKNEKKKFTVDKNSSLLFFFILTICLNCE